jgi:hypothetical protein
MFLLTNSPNAESRTLVVAQSSFDLIDLPSANAYSTNRRRYL